MGTAYGNAYVKWAPHTGMHSAGGGMSRACCAFGYAYVQLGSAHGNTYRRNGNAHRHTDMPNGGRMWGMHIGAAATTALLSH